VRDGRSEFKYTSDETSPKSKVSLSNGTYQFWGTKRWRRVGSFRFVACGLPSRASCSVTYIERKVSPRCPVPLVIHEGDKCETGVSFGVFQEMFENWAMCVQAGCGAEGTAPEIPLLPLWNRRGKCHRIVRLFIS
jgi:hypothetical protein